MDMATKFTVCQLDPYNKPSIAHKTRLGTKAACTCPSNDIR